MYSTKKRGGHWQIIIDYFSCRKGSANEEKSESEQEEGEIDDGDVHPLVTLTKIDPKDIPEVSNKFLMRGIDRAHADDDSGAKEETRDKDSGRRKDRDRDGKDKNK